MVISQILSDGDDAVPMSHNLHVNLLTLTVYGLVRSACMFVFDTVFCCDMESIFGLCICGGVVEKICVFGRK